MTIPGFRFTIIAVQHRFGVLLIRMHLNGQSFLRVNQFHQKTSLRAKRLQMCFPEESLRVFLNQIEQIRLIRHADHAAQPFNQIFSARIDGPRRAGRPILREKNLLRFSAVSFVQPGAANVGAPYAGFSGLQTKVDKTSPPSFMQSSQSFSAVFSKIV